MSRKSVSRAYDLGHGFDLSLTSHVCSAELLVKATSISVTHSKTQVLVRSEASKKAFFDGLKGLEILNNMFLSPYIIQK